MSNEISFLDKKGNLILKRCNTYFVSSNEAFEKLSLIFKTFGLGMRCDDILYCRNLCYEAGRVDYDFKVAKLITELLMTQMNDDFSYSVRTHINDIIIKIEFTKEFNIEFVYSELLEEYAKGFSVNELIVQLCKDIAEVVMKWIFKCKME